MKRRSFNLPLQAATYTTKHYLLTNNMLLHLKRGRLEPQFNSFLINIPKLYIPNRIWAMTIRLFYCNKRREYGLIPRLIRTFYTSSVREGMGTPSICTNFNRCVSFLNAFNARNWRRHEKVPYQICLQNFQPSSCLTLDTRL